MPHERILIIYSDLHFGRCSINHGLVSCALSMAIMRGLRQLTSRSFLVTTALEMVRTDPCPPNLTYSHSVHAGHHLMVFEFTGAKRDNDGYLWITGRIDDMMNMSGHLISTAEVESVLIENPSVAETAVVARPHDIKGECLYCFITLREVSSTGITPPFHQMIMARNSIFT